MAKSNPYLDKLLKVQHDLKSNQTRLDAIESGALVPQPSEADLNKRATYSDFLTPEQIRSINHSFNESLNMKVECDGLDYALACACGIISGLIDILLVKTPHDGAIGETTDKLFDKALIKLAGEKKNGDERSISSAITPACLCPLDRAGGKDSFYAL